MIQGSKFLVASGFLLTSLTQSSADTPEKALGCRGAISAVETADFTHDNRRFEGGRIEAGGSCADPGSTYHTYDSVTVELQNYTSKFPEICTLRSIGVSVDNRQLWVIKITDNPNIEEDEPEFQYVSTMHGNEPVGTEMCMNFIDFLLKSYDTDPNIRTLVDETEIWILPLMNPDGLEASPQERGNKNVNDLNRSFPDGSAGGLGNIFDGPSLDTVGLEPEVAAIINWSTDQSFVLSANFHTGSLGVIYPYGNRENLGKEDGSCKEERGNSPTPDDRLLQNLSRIYTDHNMPMKLNSDYEPDGIINGAKLKPLCGEMADWNYRYMVPDRKPVVFAGGKLKIG